MGRTITLTADSAFAQSGEGPPEALQAALVLLWSTDEPARAGEVLAPPHAMTAPCIFGRGEIDADDRYERVFLTAQRPAHNAPSAPSRDPFLSRSQLKLTRQADALHLENAGKLALLVDGEETRAAVVRPGSFVEIAGRLLFLCALRPHLLAQVRAGDASHAFGDADRFGFVGESAVAWAVRDEVAFVARRAGHVLVTGASGAGKELVARAIHAQSSRAAAKMVARNAATIPAGLIDAELFGNVANYPNAGMPERPGIIGEADGGTLLLDEIGEMPESAQAHLLRVLDAGGEYQRLGDARRRASNLRLIAATNRAPGDLKHDLLARLPLRLDVPGLNERREDIPLLVRHLLRRTAARDPEVAAAFFDREGGRMEPRVALSLIEALVRHDYTTHARELEALVWRSLATSKRGVVELTSALAAELGEGDKGGAGDKGDKGERPLTPSRPPTEVGEAEIRASLERNGGVRDRVWRDLGLSSRHALTRLMKRYGLDRDE